MPALMNRLETREKRKLQFRLDRRPSGSNPVGRNVVYGEKFRFGTTPEQSASHLERVQPEVGLNSAGRVEQGTLRIATSRSVESPPSWNGGSSSGVLSQSRRSNRPPHARQTMNSSLNVSYGPQSRPCVSIEVTNRKSPADEPQSGQAISISPLIAMSCGRGGDGGAAESEIGAVAFWRKSEVHRKLSQ